MVTLPVGVLMAYRNALGGTHEERLRSAWRIHVQRLVYKTYREYHGKK